MQKNDIVTVTIEDMGVNGEGIGKVNGYTLFIKDAVIGDVVKAKLMKAKKNYGYARLMDIIEPSADRVIPKCRFARKCGGCQIQELAYEKQLEFKEKKVKGNLERIGGFATELLERIMEPALGMEEPFYYRNKAQFPFGTDKDGNPITGFYAGRTHDIIANTDCALGVPVNQQILELILAFMKEYGIAAYDEKTGHGLIRHALIRYGFVTKEIMVCLVINGKMIPHSEVLIKELRKIPGMTSVSVSVNRKNTNVIMGDSYEVLWGQGFITDYIGSIKYQISPLSFTRSIRYRRRSFMAWPWSMRGLRGTRPFGTCTAGSERFHCFWPRRQNRSMGWRLYLRQLKMQGIMLRLMVLGMRNFISEERRMCCRSIIDGMSRNIRGRRLMPM